METDSNLNRLPHHLATSIFNGLHSSLLQATNPRQLFGLLLLLLLTPQIECAKLLRMFIDNHFLLYATFMVFFHLLLVLRLAIEFIPGGCSPHGIVRKEKCLQHLENTNYDANFQDMKVGDKLMLTSPGNSIEKYCNFLVKLNIYCNYCYKIKYCNIYCYKIKYCNNYCNI